MNEEERRQIALFRYELICVLLQSPHRGALQAQLEQVAKRVYEVPGGIQKRFSIRTLERYMADYRKGGLDALYPQARDDRHRPRALPQAVIDRAIVLRREQPARTVEQLITMLEMEGMAPKGVLKRSTLSVHLRKAGLARAKAIRKSQVWQRYTATRVHEVWQSDVCDSLRIPDPQMNGQMRVARLFAVLDDKSRYICQATYFFRENLPTLEETLKRAISKYGTPEKFYCDNGPVFQATHLTEIAARLKFRVVHSTKYLPQGRGKIEKWFGYVERAFRPEAELYVRQGKIANLEELNAYFQAWLETMYHQRVHSTLKKRPAQVVQEDGPLRLVDPLVLRQAFLRAAEAKVDKTACISVQGNTYEVEPVLVRCKVEIRYDPYDLRDIQVWYEGKRYADATPLTIRRHTDKKLAKDQVPDDTAPIETGSSFLDTLKVQDEAIRQSRAKPTWYSQKEKRGESQ
jgi:transposase InsO family protein